MPDVSASGQQFPQYGFLFAKFVPFCLIAPILLKYALLFLLCFLWFVPAGPVHLANMATQIRTHSHAAHYLGSGLGAKFRQIMRACDQNTDFPKRENQAYKLKQSLMIFVKCLYSYRREFNSNKFWSEFIERAASLMLVQIVAGSIKIAKKWGVSVLHASAVYFASLVTMGDEIFFQGQYKNAYLLGWYCSININTFLVFW